MWWLLYYSILLTALLEYLDILSLTVLVLMDIIISSGFATVVMYTEQHTGLGLLLTISIGVSWTLEPHEKAF